MISHGNNAAEERGSGNGRQTDIYQFLALGSYRTWLRLLWENGGVDREHHRRAAIVSLSSLLASPLRLYERVRYGRRIAATPIEHPPVFILGHWRSGTTYLHNIIAQDPDFCHVSCYQMAAPESSLAVQRCLKPILERLAPRQRPMDNVELTMDSPWEEEFVLAKSTPYSCYHSWSFPRRAWHYFERNGLFRGASQKELEGFKKAYLHILKKTTMANGGRRLVLKNPVNMGRIPILLDMFPDAKFIHLYRNPYTVLRSSIRSYKALLSIYQLQVVDDEQVEATIIAIYRDLYRKYFAERHLIPSGNLVDVRYEDFEADPLRAIKRIYGTLDLPFEHTAEAIERYVEAQRDYQKNNHALTPEDIDTVNQHWGFAVQALGYPLRSRRQPDYLPDTEQMVLQMV